MSSNPFLLPPDGAKPSATPRAPDPAPRRDPDHYIAVPASVESATHRINRAAPVSVPDPEPARSEPRHEPTESAVAEETRVAPQPRPRAWVLVLPDATRVGLDGPLLLGRSPAGIPDRPDAALLPVNDPGKTVSKTHALVEPAPGGVRVRDLHSTNGVAIDTSAGREVLTAGSEALAPEGATIMMGSFPLGVSST